MRNRSTTSPEVMIQIELAQFRKLVGNQLYQSLRKSHAITLTQKQFNKFVENAFQNVLSRKFARDGEVRLYQMPLGSFSAIGKFRDADIGKIVYVPGTKKHKPYQRKWVDPKDPKTPLQKQYRNLFKQAGTNWTNEPPSIKDQWNIAAKEAGEYTGQTYYIKRWFKDLKKIGLPPGLGFLP